jgi:glycosyltransferase involved in cell wall biosynthesis
LLEAMACGRPVVSAQYSGLTEYFDEEVGFPVDHRLVPAECGVYSGRWAELDEESLIAAMRQVYNDPAECVRRGALAATRARRFTWKDTGRRLAAVLDAASRNAA